MTTGAATGEQTSGPPLAPVIPLELGRARQPGGRASRLHSAVALLVAGVVAASPLADGFYNFGLWGPLTLGAVVLLVVLLLGTRPTFTRLGLISSTSLLVLLGLSAASMFWAESKDSAWTDANRLALYCVVFAIALIAVRGRTQARAIAVVLGLPALGSSIVLCGMFLFGGGAGAFLYGRLNAPIGYINGTAGLLMMGVFAWLAVAESSSKRLVRAGAITAASMVASTAVLTQSRSIVLEIVVAGVMVLLVSPQRTRRAVKLLVIVGGAAVGLHWTLVVFSSTGPAQTLPIAQSTLRDAALAIVGGALLAGAAQLGLSTMLTALPAKLRATTVTVTGRLLIATTVIGVAAVVIFAGSTIRNQYDDFTQMKTGGAVTNRFLDAGGFRYDLWRIALDEFTAHPLGGVGAGNYDVDYYRMRHNPEYVIQPHSLELQMAAELGIGGLLAILAFCGAILWAGFARRRTLASRDPALKVAAVGVFTVWLAGTSVDWLYDVPGLTGLAVLAAAVLLAPSEPSPGTSAPPARGPQRRAALVLALAGLALVAASIGRQYAATRYTASGAAQVREHMPRAAIRTLETAEQLDPYSLSTLYTVAHAYAQLDDYAGARAALLAAERREPHNYVPPALLGQLALAGGYPRVAVAYYRAALRLNPRDPFVAEDLQGAEAALR